jgi:hypothetical protein
MMQVHGAGQCGNTGDQAMMEPQLTLEQQQFLRALWITVEPFLQKQANVNVLGKLVELVKTYDEHKVTHIRKLEEALFEALFEMRLTQPTVFLYPRQTPGVTIVEGEPKAYKAPDFNVRFAAGALRPNNLVADEETECGL